MGCAMGLHVCVCACVSVCVCGGEHGGVQGRGIDALYTIGRSTHIYRSV